MDCVRLDRLTVCWCLAGCILFHCRQGGIILEHGLCKVSSIVWCVCCFLWLGVVLWTVDLIKFFPCEWCAWHGVFVSACAVF